MPTIESDMLDEKYESRTRVRPSRRKRRRKRVLGLVPRFLLIAAAVVVTAIICVGLVAKILQPYAMGHEQASQMSQIQAQLAQSDGDNASLARQANYLRRPDGIEAAARAQGYLRPGEVSLVIEGQPVSAAPADSGFTARVRRAWKNLTGR